MAVTSLRSTECGFHQCNVKLFGRTIRGISGWELSKEKEKEHLYGAGQEPIDIVSGTNKYQGKLTVYGFEYDAMNMAAQAAGYEDILEVPHEFISMTITFRRSLTDPVTVITATGMAFTKIPHAASSGDKNRSYDLEFICMSANSTTTGSTTGFSI